VVLGVLLGIYMYLLKLINGVLYGNHLENRFSTGCKNNIKMILVI
jgi:hypothetical protein